MHLMHDFMRPDNRNHPFTLIAMACGVIVIPTAVLALLVLIAK